MRALARLVVQMLLRVIFHVAVWLYGSEGANLILQVMPMQLIPAVLRSYKARIGVHTRLHAPLVIHNASDTGGLYRNLTIGTHCYLGRDLLLDLREPIIIGHRVTISLGVSIFTHTDAGESPLA